VEHDFKNNSFFAIKNLIIKIAFLKWLCVTEVIVNNLLITFDY